MVGGVGRREGVRESTSIHKCSGIPSYKVTNPIPRAPHSTKLNSFPKTPHPNSITMVVRDSEMNDGRGIVQSIAPWLT